MLHVSIKGDFGLLAFPPGTEIIDLAAKREGSTLADATEPATLSEIVKDSVQIKSLSFSSKMVSVSRVCSFRIGDQWRTII